MKSLRFKAPNGLETIIAVETERQTLGRCGGGADLEIPGDRHISRRHGCVWAQEGEIWYEDLGSANGSWLGEVELDGPSRVEPGVRIVVGETEMTLGPERPVDPVFNAIEEKMTLRLEAPPSKAPGASLLGPYMTALYEFVQGLLEVTSHQLIPQTLTRIYEVVPAAQRISLVSPPAADGRCDPLIPSEDLVSNYSGGPISVSLVRHAIASGKALLLSEDTPVLDPAAGHSAKMRGIRSAVYVPLTSLDGETMGVLCVDTPEPSLPFTEQDFDFLCAVGGLLAAALSSERLREAASQQELQTKELAARHETMTAFLKIASHDLKNPLTAIKLGASIIESKAKSETERIYAGIILDSTNRAQELIATYLEVAQIEQALAIEPEEVHLGRLFEEEVQFLKQAQSNELPFTFLAEFEVNVVWADRQKLRQVLTNVISNALKYSPSGGMVRASSQHVGADTVIAIQDEGVGISSEDQAKLFQQFQRVGDRSLSSGTGLGLWLTQALVEAHGGRIWVSSSPGEGSTFSWSLPARRHDNLSIEHEGP